MLLGSYEHDALLGLYTQAFEVAVCATHPKYLTVLHNQVFAHKVPERLHRAVRRSTCMKIILVNFALHPQLPVVIKRRLCWTAIGALGDQRVG